MGGIGGAIGGPRPGAGGGGGTSATVFLFGILGGGGGMPLLERSGTDELISLFRLGIWGGMGGAGGLGRDEEGGGGGGTFLGATPGALPRRSGIGGGAGG